ncbi:MAG: hypothetical protein IPM53_21380 [Anaerolineaceae bacterium]|nr:hypothetical protein [Anaerolineaceae bacterium]
MFNFLRNLTKSAEENRQEAVTAYLDEALNDRERQRFEQEMAQDAALRAHVEQLLLIKQSLRQLPQRQVPRNFILDPAAYGRPARQPWVQAYPVLRTATVLAAFFFIFAIAAGIFTTGGGDMAMAPAADVAQVEVTRVVTEMVETDAFEAAPAAEAEMAEEPASEDTATSAAANEAEDESALVEAVETMEEAAEEAAAEAVEEAAEEPPSAIAATQVAPLPAESTEETTSEDAEGAIPTPAETREAQPTPTVSTIPRVTPPTPLPDRIEDGDTVAEVPELDDDTETSETTAVLREETVTDTTVEGPVSTLFWLQIGLGVLLLMLLGLTFYARRQR